MSDEEILAAAWKELLVGAESSAADWIDEEGGYGTDAQRVFRTQFVLLRALTAQGPPAVEVWTDA